MKPITVAALCFSCFFGCMAGSWLALRPSVVAQAQVLNPRGTVPPNVKFDDKITIPDQGLQLVGQKGQPLGFWSVTENGLSLTMLSRAGRPGVILEAGTGGAVTVGATSDRAGLAVQNNSGMRLSSLITNDEAATELTNQGRTMTLSVGADAKLSIPGRGKSSVFEVAGLPDGASLSLKSRTGTPVLTATSDLEESTLTLLGIKAKGRVTISGRGEAGISKDGQTVWTASPSAKSAGDAGSSTTGLPPGSTGGGEGR